MSLLKKFRDTWTRAVQTHVVQGSAGLWGSSLDNDSESVIVHFLIGSFIFSVLPTVFLKRLSFPSARLCRNWLPGSLSPRRTVPHSSLSPFWWLRVAARQPLAVLSYVWVQESGFTSGLLKGGLASSSRRSYRCALYRLQASSSHPAWRRPPSLSAPFPPFRDCKPVLLIKPSCDGKNTGRAGRRKPTTFGGKERLQRQGRACLLPKGG